MQNNFVLFDYDGSVTDALQNAFKDLQNFSFWTGDCRKIISSMKIDIIVSPANSSGYMDGGIDLYYAMMFPGIGKTVHDKIKTYKIPKTHADPRTNRKMLPIGSAFIVKTNSAKCPELICAPTMEDPDDIRGTQNVYFAFYGVLKSLKDRKNLVVAIPGFGTGCGQLSAKECATQMRRAYDDYINDISKIEEDNVLLIKEDEFILRSHACDPIRNLDD